MNVRRMNKCSVFRPRLSLNEEFARLSLLFQGVVQPDDKPD
jgi:hypothetical protein